MEIQHFEIRRDGFFFDEDTLRLDLYRLLSCFYASADFARLALREGSREKVAELAGDYQEFEVTRLLVTIAATVRVVQDRDKDIVPNVKTKCGSLFPDAGSRKSKPLSLRDACNKIIHARKFNFDVRKIRIRDGHITRIQHALNPVMHLYGEQDGVHWKATLDILGFVACTTVLIKG